MNHNFKYNLGDIITHEGITYLIRGANYILDVELYKVTPNTIKDNILFKFRHNTTNLSKLIPVTRNCYIEVSTIEDVDKAQRYLYEVDENLL